MKYPHDCEARVQACNYQSLLKSYKISILCTAYEETLLYYAECCTHIGRSVISCGLRAFILPTSHYHKYESEAAFRADQASRHANLGGSKTIELAKTSRSDSTLHAPLGGHHTTLDERTGQASTIGTEKCTGVPENEILEVRLSLPMKSAKVSGPMGWFVPSFIPRSMSCADATCKRTLERSGKVISGHKEVGRSCWGRQGTILRRCSD